MKKLGAILVVLCMLVAAIPATAATSKNEVISACDTAVEGTTVATPHREGAASLQLTVNGGSGSAQLDAAAAIDFSDVKFRDGAVMFWLYVDTAANFEKLNVQLLNEGGSKYYTWDLAKYASVFTEGKWNLMALPFKELSEDHFAEEINDIMDLGALDYSALKSVKIAGNGLDASAVVYIDDVRVLDYTAYLKENHGILFFDSFEIDSLWATTRTEDATTGKYAVDFDIDLARTGSFYMNSEYVTAVNPYKLFNGKNDNLDLSGANLATMDIYWKAKVIGDKQQISSLGLHLSNLDGGYQDLYSYEMNIGDLTEEYQRFTSYRSKNFSIVSVPGAQLNLKKISAMRVMCSATDPIAATKFSVQVDDLMIVNSRKYTGLENVNCIEVADLGDSGNTTPSTGNEGNTTPSTGNNNEDNTTSTTNANSGTETEGGLPIGLIIGIVAAVVVIAAVVVVVVMKKKKA